MSTDRPRLTALFILQAVIFAGLAFALLDRRAHERDAVFGLNQWGYRHEARGAREAGERRVAILGGSSVFEAGHAYDVTMAGQLFIELRQAGAAERRVYSVVNLSEPQAGADTFVRTLRDYRYLDPDLVCIVDGYDRLSGEPPHGRDRSLVFRATGYLPMLPAKLFGGRAWLSDADEGIAPTLRDDSGDRGDVSCAAGSASYCAAIADAVRAGLDQGRAVMVVSPPVVSGRHGRQQQSLAESLGRAFGTESRFRYLDLGGSIDLSDRFQSPDGIHRTDVGNHVVAQRIAHAILAWPGAFDR